MRHRLGSAVLAVSLLAGCGGTEPAPSSEPVAQQQAPLTATDVDVAPECQGIISFVNQASFTTLDVYLPSNVASNLVGKRAVAPFVTLADVASVPLVGDARLTQLETGARTEGFINASCVGIRDQVALSADDEAAIVALVNTISDSELHGILPDAWNGAVNLLNTRPFTSSYGIANTAGIGADSLRNIRNAATLSRPLEVLAAAVTAAPHYGNYGSSMARHFDWYDTMWDAVQAGRSHVTCFGIDPDILPQGAEIRSNLADADEVRGAVAYAVSLASNIPQPVRDAGMANLETHIENRLFQGCVVSYEPDPWSGHTIRFFIDPETGFGVTTETWWAE
ncbi:hypothetical protein P2318_28600 [Myxococcaceae bacterium GXIMD 01537]